MFTNRASGFFRTKVLKGNVSANKFFGNWPASSTPVSNPCCPSINNGCCEPTPMPLNLNGSVFQQQRL